MDQHSRKPRFLRAYTELIRNLIDMRGRFGFYLQTSIPRGLVGFRVHVSCPLQTHRKRRIRRTNISSLRPRPNIRPVVALDGESPRPPTSLLRTIDMPR